MNDKAFCSFQNVGYCKYKDKCSNKHAKDDYEDTSCIKKPCHMRHKKTCKNGLQCKFNSKNNCEFKHDPEHQTDKNFKISKMLSQIKSLELEIKKSKIKQ